MDKIDIRDLRAGNWVSIPEPDHFAGAMVKISSLSNQEGAYFTVTVDDPEFGYYTREVFCEDIEPITLTAEILEKNFEVTYNGSRIYEESDCRFYLIPLSDGKSVPAFLSPGNGIPFLKIADVHHVRCHYVHQLQNILRDMGIDKEIIL